MSRIGKKPVIIPSGVKIELAGQTVKVSGPKGSLEIKRYPAINVKLDDSGKKIIVENSKPDGRSERAMYGTTRALLNNMVKGVSKGFERKMEIYGTGYNVKEQNGKLVLTLGFAHPAEVKIPKTVKVLIEIPATKGNDTPAKFTITGYDKQELGQFAAEVRKVKPPEPYQGKGIRYADEHVRRKAGKAFASGAA
ncbi:MAG: 50S ribosomal protein L6 [Planctomycetes bacterium]|nr:50S ribosomal protein L6 [Planctomycetota bacterium]MBU1517321.1 50S ribosomal protein L6 [Planctomycetota bacterium]MBU2458425.1 50S ribosomal protein L6 [Planctomycetota bacterium]MBU2596439.1 50S ribosomal protein L6 [Planctomycetota bacterium]